MLALPNKYRRFRKSTIRMSGDAMSRLSAQASSETRHIRTPPRMLIVQLLMLASPMFIASRAGAQVEEVEETPREEGEGAQAEVQDSRAREAFDRGDYREALDALRTAQDISPATARLYNMAQCHEGLGDNEQAIELYQQYMVAPEALEGRRRIARQRIERLSDRVDEAPTTETPPPRDTLRPFRIAFFSLVGVTSTLSVSCGALGAVTLSRHGEFLLAYQEDAGVQELSSQGRSLAFATDIMLGMALVSAVATLVVGLIWYLRHRRGGQRNTLSLQPLHPLL